VEERADAEVVWILRGGKDPYPCHDGSVRGGGAEVGGLGRGEEKRERDLWQRHKNLLSP
jgi:hypothetical protein